VELLRKTILLTDEEIMSASEEIAQVYKSVMKKKAEPETKIKLSVEEMLLNCRAASDADTECVMKVTKHFGKVKVDLKSFGSDLNALRENSVYYEYSDYSEAILESFNLKPRYEYRIAERGYNKVSLVYEKPPVKNMFLYMMLGAIALAVGLYLVLLPMSGNPGMFIMTNITEPIFNKLTSIISAIATPLIFFAVLTGIIGIGDVQAVGNIGKKLVLEIMITYTLAGLVFGTLGGITYYTGNIGGSAAAEEGVVQSILTLVLDIVPGNLFEPFITMNDLQVITISIFAGVAVLLVIKSIPVTKKLCFELSTLFNKMMLVVSKLLPLLVFFGIFNMLVSGTFTELINLYKMVLIFIFTCAVIIVSLTIRTRILTGIPVRILLKKQLPAFLITLTTSSQVAAIPENMVCFKEKFGIKGDFVDFSFPLCVVTYMPCGSAFLGLTVLALGNMGGIPITISVIVKVVLVAIIIAIAAPPIPGSAFAVLPIAFASCGVPYSVYPIAIVLATILGYFLPPLNCYCLQLKTLITAYKLNIVDKSKLEAEL